MTPENSIKVNYKKIVLLTFLYMLFLLLITIIMNTWPQIKQSLDGQVPPLDVWLNHSLKLSNVYLFVIAIAYIFYSLLIKEKQKVASALTDKDLNQ